jgi:hypothetical protein
MPALDIGKHTAAISDKETAAALRKVEEAVNHLAKNTGGAPIGETSAPRPIQQLQVKVSGEQAHAVITDNNSIQKNVNYFLEYATEPNFLQPHVADLGTSRGTVLTLPTNQDAVVGRAAVPHSWYFRAFSQYPGSKPSAHVYYGGTRPQAVTMQGTTNLTLLPSTGSGTASPTGQQGGWGLGKFLNRSAMNPKRAVNWENPDAGR